MSRLRYFPHQIWNWGRNCRELAGFHKRGSERELYKVLSYTPSLPLILTRSLFPSLLPFFPLLQPFYTFFIPSIPSSLSLSLSISPSFFYIFYIWSFFFISLISMKILVFIFVPLNLILNLDQITHQSFQLYFYTNPILSKFLFLKSDLKLIFLFIFSSKTFIKQN